MNPTPSVSRQPSPNRSPSQSLDDKSTPSPQQNPEASTSAARARDNSSLPARAGQSEGARDVSKNAFTPVQTIGEKPEAGQILRQELEAWQTSGPTEEYAARERACDTMMQAFDTAAPYLSLGDHGLTSVPECLGQLSALQHLNLVNNKLTSIPDLPPALEWLWLNKNQLTTLPKTFEASVAGGSANVGHNPWTQETLQRFAELPPTTTLVTSGLPDWLTKHRESVETRPSIDSTIGRQSAVTHGALAAHDASAPSSFWNWKATDEKESANFGIFLHSLEELPEFKHPQSRERIIGDVETLMASMTHSSDLRALCYMIAEPAAINPFQAAMALKQMNAAKLNHDAEASVGTPAEIFAMARAAFKDYMLPQIVLKSAASAAPSASSAPHARVLFDELSTYLHYDELLEDALPDTQKKPRHYAHYTREVTDQDLAEAKRMLKTDASNPAFTQFLTQWSPWKKVLQRSYPEQFDQHKGTGLAMIQASFAHPSGPNIEELKAAKNEIAAMEAKLVAELTREWVGQEGKV